jgi:ABC-type uncharacterized transport system involved in gliding motility auxiliary subunit
MTSNIKKSQQRKYAAGLIIFLSFATLVMLDIIGQSDLYNKILFVILIGFFTFGLIWWWWAVDKIINLTKLLIKTENDLLEISKEVIEIKKEIKSLDELSKK